MSEISAPYHAGIVMSLLSAGAQMSGMRLTNMDTVRSGQDFSIKPITYRLIMDDGKILQIKVSGIEINPPEVKKEA